MAKLTDLPKALAPVARDLLTTAPCCSDQGATVDDERPAMATHSHTTLEAATMTTASRHLRSTFTLIPLVCLGLATVGSGACYHGVGLGLGGGRVDNKQGVRAAGGFSLGGAYDFGAARVGIGAVPIGNGFTYGAEVRAELCLRSRNPERDPRTGRGLGRCATDRERNMLNLRAHWLPGMYFDDDPTEYPERIGYDTGLFVALGYSIDLRASQPSDDLRIRQYANAGIGLFFSRDWFNTRSGDWSAGVYAEWSARFDFVQALGDLVSRGSH
jgi:hypothetical protein